MEEPTTVLVDWDEFDERDVGLLPYWLAGRVSDETHAVALQFLGNEDPMMRSILAGEVVKGNIPVTEREWIAMLFDEDLLKEEEEFVAAGGLVSRSDIDQTVRENWRFEPAMPTDEEFESVVLAVAAAEPGVSTVSVAWRVGTDGTRTRLYVGTLDAEVERQDDFWDHVEMRLIDVSNERRTLDKKLVRIPPFESIRQGWDWPVYYRDMVANSRLIWSASGEDVDLRALAESQPREI